MTVVLGPSYTGMQGKQIVHPAK